MVEAVDLLRVHQSAVKKLTPNNRDLTKIDRLIECGEKILEQRDLEFSALPEILGVAAKWCVYLEQKLQRI